MATTVTIRRQGRGRAVRSPLCLLGDAQATLHVVEHSLDAFDGCLELFDALAGVGHNCLLSRGHGA